MQQPYKVAHSVHPAAGYEQVLGDVSIVLPLLVSAEFVMLYRCSCSKCKQHVHACPKTSKGEEPRDKAAIIRLTEHVNVIELYILV